MVARTGARRLDRRPTVRRTSVAADLRRSVDILRRFRLSVAVAYPAENVGDEVPCRLPGGLLVDVGVPATGGGVAGDGSWRGDVHRVELHGSTVGTLMLLHSALSIRASLPTFSSQ